MNQIYEPIMNHAQVQVHQQQILEQRQPQQPPQAVFPSPNVDSASLKQQVRCEVWCEVYAEVGWGATSLVLQNQSAQFLHAVHTQPSSRTFLTGGAL
jgi:hypothetical protein